MSADTWAVFGQIAGIGGLALGVFLLLFRDIIRRNIFPRLNKADGYRLMRLLALCVWSVAIVGIGAWIAKDLLASPSTKHQEVPLSQTTTGDGSPAIGGTTGDVNVHVNQ